MLSPNSPDPSPFPRLVRSWGAWAVLFGAIGLMLVMAQIIGPSFQDQPSAATQIGEMAGEMRRAAWRSFLGLEQPAPEPTPTPIWTYLAGVAPVLGCVAIILSLVSALKRENWRLPTYGAGLGVAAIVFQFVWWVVLLVAGVLLLIAIIENIGDIFGG